MNLPIPNSFYAKTLNTSEIDTPIMRQIITASEEAILDWLQEHLDRERLVAITESDLRREVDDDFKPNFNRLPHLMRDLGWRREKVKWGGLDYARVLYLREGYRIDRGRVYGPDGFDVPMADSGLKYDQTAHNDIDIVQ